MDNKNIPPSLAALKQPSAGVDERESVEVIGAVILGGLFHGGSGPELGDIDIELNTDVLERIQQKTITSSDDVMLPLMTVAQHERLWQARAQLAAPAGVPDPTHAMVLAGEAQWENSGIEAPDVAAIYRAMLAAAQSTAPTDETAHSDDVGVPRELKVIEAELSRITHDPCTSTDTSEELAAVLIALRALLNGGRS